MCTVTFIPRQHGFLLAMNRDEAVTRAAALPPQIRRNHGVRTLYPSEPSGGAWISVNEFGCVLALVNWYAVGARVKRHPQSRGELVAQFSNADSGRAVERDLESFALDRVNPFRMIGFFPKDRRVIEWRWNLERLQQKKHAWKPAQWISSGYDEPGARRIRSRIFQRYQRQKSAGSLEWLRRLHRSHLPRKGAYSNCMHREDARTVSYTEILAGTWKIRMRYLNGPPCEAGRAYSRELKRRAVET